MNNEKENFNKETIKNVMSIVTEMAKSREGSFFIITKADIKSEYENLYPELFDTKKVNIEKPEARTLLLKLSELDGAIIVDNGGNVLAYGAKIKRTKVLFGHGTRHSAARGISKKQNVMAIISSEEDGKIRVFEKGEMLAEIDPETGKDSRFVDKIASYLSKPDLQVATSSGVASLFLFGLNPIVAGIVFTGSFVITKYGIGSMSEFIKTGRIIVKDSCDYNFRSPRQRIIEGTNKILKQKKTK